MGEDPTNRRGVLYPDRLPSFHRVLPTPDLADRVRWFWIPEWSLPDGVASRQEILPFPACNLVVEPAGVTVVGPPTRRSERVLTGTGWAVGALLRPAAVPALLPDPAALRDAAAPVSAAALHAQVVAAMTDRAQSGEDRRATAVTALSAWVASVVPPVGTEGRLANALADALGDPALTRADQLPERLHASARTLQRVAQRFFGLSLHSMIRRRRLQEAAERLRHDGTGATAAGPASSLAALATELGYADHAHFATEFRAVLGVTPSEYRSRARAEAAAADA
ncbi:Transcriptional regulator, AraC family [Leucobacter sp. 7(1)]|uniref:helix-turn-helix transcriptional regulator n=1 Tax=Leucobacter sp. 7(1) TaxID=1255613 RepID=UPI00097E77FF|nr:helix-turn-helix transcriptional regulator [Leucobacter sp. 7(1)]SJN12314.1 Transcriptional regulator, AraC family [Leucobacter sp. 7(1)]